MFGLLIKLVLCPSVVYFSELLLTQVSFANWYQPLIVGWTLASSAHVMELWLLTAETVWMSTIIDFIAAAIIVYTAGIILSNVSISLIGVVLTAGALAVTEYFQHTLLTQSGEVIK